MRNPLLKMSKKLGSSFCFYFHVGACVYPFVIAIAQSCCGDFELATLVSIMLG